MKALAESFGVAACGLVTSVLTALAVVAVSKMTGFDLFTFSVWLVVPVGAAITGFAAASGYYFGSLYFHKRAGWPLLIQMVAIAGVTQLLIYYMGYNTLVLDDGRRATDIVSFGQYLEISLTSAHYSIGRRATDLGEVGRLGYLLATLQFLGFLAGGLAIYGWLLAKPVCAACNLYLRPLSRREKTFPSPDSATDYLEALSRYAVGGPEFAALIRSDAKATAEKNAVFVKTFLHGCPQCKAQLVEEEVQVYDGREWKDVNALSRRINVPTGVDLLAVFRA